MDNNIPVYVLVTLSINSKGEVQRKNVGVTFSIHEAEQHQAQGVEHEFETLSVSADWQSDADTTALSLACRTFRDIVAEQTAEALR